MPDNESPESTAPPEEQELEKRVETIMGEQPDKEIQSPSPTPKIPQATINDIAPAPQGAIKKPKSEVATDAATEGSDKLIHQIGDTPEESEPVVDEIPTSDPTIHTERAADDDDQPRAITPVDTTDLPPEPTSTEAVDTSQSNEAVVMSERWTTKLGRIFKNKWLWLFVIIILVAVLGWPMTRYKVLGFIFKEPVTIDIIDSKTKTPVSDVSVSLAGQTTISNASGVATIKVPPGEDTLKVMKQYYQTYTINQFVGIGSSKTMHVRLIATGRQVPITVLNKITGQPVVGAEIAVLNTSAKANQSGEATIVLPVQLTTATATVTLSGYNSMQMTIKVTNQKVSANVVNLTPAGQIYYLSDTSGTIDVMKSDLDGTNHQTVLAGTGKETPNSTSLLASRDWRYLVLQSERSGQPGLYLINASTDKTTEFDSSTSPITMVGWYGHNFVYDVVNNSVPVWQSGHEQLKSYDADTGQLNLLDQNQAEGSAASYAEQNFGNFFIVNGLVVYSTLWSTVTTSGSPISTSNDSDTIRGIETTGQNKKDYQSEPAGTFTSISAVLSGPSTIDFSFNSTSSNSPTYYQFANQTVASDLSLTPTTFNQSPTTYLFSPSGSQTIWGKQTSGQNSFLIGNQNGQDQKVLSGLDNYMPYAWYGDNYLIVSQNNDQLYIVPATGPRSGQVPLLLTDYYQVPEQYPAIEDSYGGL